MGGISRTIGSYVLVSNQSQTCSSHYTESCITTRSPWLGMMMCSPRVGEVRVQLKPAQPSTIKAAVAKWSVSISTVKSSRLGCSMQVETLQYDIKALQEEVDDEKAEQETPLYVGYIRCMYATILSFPRLQIYPYILK